MSPGSLPVPLVGVKVCTRGRTMLRVRGKMVCFSFTAVTLRILVILPPDYSEEIWTHEVEVVAGAAVFFCQRCLHTSGGQGFGCGIQR